MNLDFSEIEKGLTPQQAGARFEDLAASYFRKLKEQPENRILKIDVQPSGTGGDGGRDILITFGFNDSIVDYERTWVVQCKFLTSAVSTHDLSNVNIPTLVHQYNADGYLLICKDKAAISTTNMFEGLRSNCKFSYYYQIWTGNEFKDKLYTLTDLHKEYFPKYNRYIKEMEKGRKVKKR